MHQLTSSVRPIRTAADIRGLKLRVPGSKLYQDFFRSLGADVHTLNLNRTHDALKAGEIDSQDDPWDDVELLKLYEFQKYGSMTNHSWSGYNALANLKRWQSFPPDVQRAIETNTRKYVQLQRTDTDRLNGELRVGLYAQRHADQRSRSRFVQTGARGVLSPLARSDWPPRLGSPRRPHRPARTIVVISGAQEGNDAQQD